MNLGHEPWADILQAMGLTVTWQDSAVIAVSGQRLAAYRDRLDQIFAGGVLMDLSALECLVAMGREGLAGVRLKSVFRRPERATPMEHISDGEFGGGPDYRVTLDQAGLTVRVGELEAL